MEITQNTILKLVVRQGTDDDRKKVTLTSGEPGYATDTQRLFIGDGFTDGGILVGNKFRGFTPVTSVSPSEIGDYIFNTTTQQFFVLAANDGSSPTDWTQVGTVYVGTNYIFIDPSTNQISLNPLSAGAFDMDSAGNGLYVDGGGRLAVTPSTITIINGLSASVNGNNVTGQNISPLSGNIVIGINTLGAVFDSTAAAFPLSVVGGKLTLPTRTVAISSGLQGFVDGVDVTNTPINPLSSNLTIVTNDVLARFDGLSGGIIQYYRNLFNVDRLSAGDYNFTYGIPTNNAYASVDLYGLNIPNFYPRVMSVSNTVTNVQILSSSASDIKTDANIFFRLTY